MREGAWLASFFHFISHHFSFLFIWVQGFFRLSRANLGKEISRQKEKMPPQAQKLPFPAYS